MMYDPNIPDEFYIIDDLKQTRNFARRGAAFKTKMFLIISVLVLLIIIIFLLTSLLNRIFM